VQNSICRKRTQVSRVWQSHFLQEPQRAAAVTTSKKTGDAAQIDFSHRSDPKAPHLCLAIFDELKQLGLEEFTKKHDPYWDIPLNENLPQPVIDLSVIGETGAVQGLTEVTNAELRLSSRPAAPRRRNRSG
jgi:hypothetical protein